MKNQNTPLRIALAIIIFLLIILSVFVLGIYSGKRSEKSAVDENNPAKAYLPLTDDLTMIDSTKTATLSAMKVKDLVTPVNELVSTQYDYKNVGNYKKNSGIAIFKNITTSEIIYVYTGTIKAGINLNDATFDVDDETQTIIIRLPEPVIISHEIDMGSFSFYDVKNSLFTDIKPQNVTDQIEKLKKNTEKDFKETKAYKEDIINNTKVFIKTFLSNTDLTKEYTIEFQ